MAVSGFVCDGPVILHGIPDTEEILVVSHECESFIYLVPPASLYTNSQCLYLVQTAYHTCDCVNRSDNKCGVLSVSGDSTEHLLPLYLLSKDL